MIIPDGFAQITHVFSGAAAPTGAVVTYGIVNIDHSSASDLAEAGHTLWAETILAVQNDDITLASTLCKNGPNSTGASAEFSDPQGGGNANAGAGPQVSYLVQKLTGHGGRKGQGRMFIPGATEADFDSSGVLDGTRFGVIQDAVGAFFDGWDGSPHGLALLHSLDGDDPYDITALALSSRVATQRQRMRR